MSRVPMQEILKPLAWLEGTWRTESVGAGQFPTIKPFQYCEEIKFEWNLQPMFNYVGQSSHPEHKRPMHREIGFLKPIPGTNRVSLILAHNFGLTSIEEGVIGDNLISLKSTSIVRPTEGTKPPAVTKLERQFKLNGDRLEHILSMATETTPDLTQHLHAIYIKLSGASKEESC